jgi:putative drug exporter of the RND superfamily
MIFTWLAWFAVRSPRRIVVGALLFAVAAGVFGIPVSASLPAGGYEVPTSESARAERLLNDKFDAGGMSIVFAITGPANADSPAVRVRGQAIVDALRASGYARQVISYWTAPPVVATSLLSAGRRTALVVAQIAGSDGEAPPRAHAIAQSLTGTRDDIAVSAGGQAITYYDMNRQSRDDLVKTEIIAIPTTFVVLIWVFGSAVAALLPIAIAVFAIAGAAAALRGLFLITDVSVFAVNLATALSLALAIDYTLFIINRYREELSAGLPREQALIRTMSTAGRTVTYSALTVALSLAAMAVFPMYFLRSLAYAGLTSVALCLFGALLVAPALLVILGDRIDAFDIRKPVRRLFGRPAPRSRAVTESLFYRAAASSMKHAVPVALIVAALFVTLAVPFLSLKVAFPDDRILPESAPTRQAGDLLRDEFPQNITGSVRVVLPAGAGTSSAVEHYAAGLSRVADVAAVTAPRGTYAGGRRIGTETYGAAADGDAAYLSVFSTLDPVSASGQGQLAALKQVPAPAAVLFGGIAQQNLDSVNGIASKLPVVISLIVVTTLLLLFLLTGSVLLPIKALVMNALSLTAAFGAIVWIFQDGHLAGLGTTTIGHVNAAFPPLIFCIAFGLSMDYEVFVLSRVREEWTKSGRTVAENERAVAVGLARTGRIVTAAATLMAIVFLAISASDVSSMRMLGVGLTITVLVDAFVIRIILVPAAMRLMGRANWWAPAPLARWHAKWGLTEGADIEHIPMVRETAPTDQSIAKSARSAAQVDGRENDAQRTGDLAALRRS